MVRTAQNGGAEIQCLCGRWTWRQLSSSTGTSALERWCPKCKAKRLVVLRAHRVQGVVDLPGRDIGSFRQALTASGLGREEVRVLVDVARVMGG